MQVILDSSFARPGSAPIWGGKKVEFRDWTRLKVNQNTRSPPLSENLNLEKEFSVLGSLRTVPLLSTLAVNNLGLKFARKMCDFNSFFIEFLNPST